MFHASASDFSDILEFYGFIFLFFNTWPYCVFYETSEQKKKGTFNLLKTKGVDDHHSNWGIDIKQLIPS